MAPKFGKDEELHAYREMLLIRRFEEKAGQLYGMGLIRGFCHRYMGQEAVVVGMQMATKEGYQGIIGYREHGHMLASGMHPNGVMAELTARRDALSKPFPASRSMAWMSAPRSGKAPSSMPAPARARTSSRCTPTATVATPCPIRQKYRSKDEGDPRSRGSGCHRPRAPRLLEDWKLSEDELKAMDSKVRETVDEASDFATNDPEPDPSELHTEILL